NGAGSIALSLNSSSATLQGNAFNGNSQLVKLDSSAKLPVLDGSALTNVAGSVLADAPITGNGTSGSHLGLSASSVTLQGNSFNGASQLLLLSGSALVPNNLIDASSITQQGNTFNG